MKFGLLLEPAKLQQRILIICSTFFFLNIQNDVHNVGSPNIVGQLSTVPLLMAQYKQSTLDGPQLNTDYQWTGNDGFGPSIFATVQILMVHYC